MVNSVFKPCIIIPCYRHVDVLVSNIELLLSFGIFIYIVDDGNVNEDKSKLENLSIKYKNILLLSQTTNMGKGSAMTYGFSKAVEDGFTHALQIDADGQQDVNLIPKLISISSSHPDHLISGTPIYDNDIPKLRLFSRYITHFWVAIELGLFQVTDTMCGMRVYPLNAVSKIITKRKIGSRMDFDTEIFVRLYWSGVNFIEQKVKVSYPINGFSNFAPFRDNVLISMMHTRLCFEKIIHYFKIRKREYF